MWKCTKAFFSSSRAPFLVFVLLLGPHALDCATPYGGWVSCILLILLVASFISIFAAAIYQFITKSWGRALASLSLLVIAFLMWFMIMIAIAGERRDF